MDAAAQLDGFLDKFTPDIAAHARAVLARMRTRVPGAVQLVYDNYNALAIGFGANEKVSGVVFSVAVYPRWVSLFFAGGPSLPDPLGLLQGTGNTVRHVVLKDLAVFDSPGVQALIGEGLARATPPIDPTRESRLIIKSVSKSQRPRRPSVMVRSFIVAGLFHLCATAFAYAADPAADVRDIVIDGRHVAFHVTAGRLPVLVLDAGGGNDSSYWDTIVPALFKRTGSAIITYDRAGLGDSDAARPPFRMADAVGDLEAGLKQIGATHDLVLVPHSFAGEVATYLAIRHPDWIKGAVLVDTNVPQFFTDAEIQHLDAQIKPFVAQMAKNTDKRSTTLVAVAKEYVPTSEAFHKAVWPAAIPCTVIVSDSTPFPPQMQPDRDAWTLAHIAFTSGAPNRQLVLAKGSSHDIAHDQPHTIVDAVGALVDTIRAKRP